MPFKKVTTGKNKGKYRSESGRIYTKKQVAAYYATNGWKRKPRKGEVMPKKTGLGGQAGIGAKSKVMSPTQARAFTKKMLAAFAIKPKQKSIWTQKKVYDKLLTMTPQQAKNWHAKTVGPKVK